MLIASSRKLVSNDGESCSSTRCVTQPKRGIRPGWLGNTQCPELSYDVNCRSVV